MMAKINLGNLNKVSTRNFLPLFNRTLKTLVVFYFFFVFFVHER